MYSSHAQGSQGNHTKASEFTPEFLCGGGMGRSVSSAISRCLLNSQTQS